MGRVVSRIRQVIVRDTNVKRWALRRRRWNGIRMMVVVVRVSNGSLSSSLSAASDYKGTSRAHSQFTLGPPPMRGSHARPPSVRLARLALQ